MMHNMRPLIHSPPPPHLNSHAVKVRAPPAAVLLGAMVGPLLGGLYDAQHRWHPCPPPAADGTGPVACDRWAGDKPMAPVAVALLVLAAVTGGVRCVFGCQEDG